MKKIFLIRHAESEANVGGIFEHNRLVKLSENGRQQAKDLVEVLEKPDRVIVSKFLRTQETAEPLLQKYPEIETHLWLDTHEFDYLDRKDFVGKPKEEFELHAKKFWENSDPEKKDLDRLESFREFTDRVHKAILRMNNLDKVNYIFTHGHFIALFGHLTNNYTRESLEQEKEKPDFYKNMMSGLNQAYERNEYLTAKNTEVIDVTQLVEKYLGN